MAKKKKPSIRRARSDEDLRLNPERRACPRFDGESIARFRVAEPGEMGFRVLDNCAEENQK